MGFEGALMAAKEGRTREAVKGRTCASASLGLLTVGRLGVEEELLNLLEAE